MENPGQLQLAPWDRQLTTRVLSRPHRYCPTGRPAQQRQLGHAAFGTSQCATSRHQDSPAHPGRCRPLARPATATCHLVQDNPHQRAARHDRTRPGSLDRPADRSRELGGSGILTT
jgi:hypothetical protein